MDVARFETPTSWQMLIAQLDIEEWELLENIARKTLKKG